MVEAYREKYFHCQWEYPQVKAQGQGLQGLLITVHDLVDEDMAFATILSKTVGG